MQIILKMEINNKVIHFPHQFNNIHRTTRFHRPETELDQSCIKVVLNMFGPHLFPHNLTIHPHPLLNAGLYFVWGFLG